MRTCQVRVRRLIASFLLAKGLTMSLLTTVRGLPDAALMAALETCNGPRPEFTLAQLAEIQEAFCPEDCDCELVLLPCGCPGCCCEPDPGAARRIQEALRVFPKDGDREARAKLEEDLEDALGRPCDGRCGCVPDYAPCPHFKAFYLPVPAQILISLILEPEPPLPLTPDDAESSAAMAVVMAERANRAFCRCGWRGDTMDQKASMPCPKCGETVIGVPEAISHPKDAILRGAEQRIARQGTPNLGNGGKDRWQALKVADKDLSWMEEEAAEK
jgi:hypothetical protein